MGGAMAAEIDRRVVWRGVARDGWIGADEDFAALPRELRAAMVPRVQPGFVGAAAPDILFVSPPCAGLPGK
jgi:hypothetical protein